MLRVREGLLSREPFIVQRQVLWGECDPAGFVYTPRFAEYAVGAAALFNSEMIADCLCLRDGQRIGLPVKALAFQFEKFLRPDDIFEMKVCVGTLTERTFELRIDAISTSAERHFCCQITRICLDPRLNRSVQMPLDLRQRLTMLGGRSAN